MRCETPELAQLELALLSMKTMFHLFASIASFRKPLDYPNRQIRSNDIGFYHSSKTQHPENHVCLGYMPLACHLFLDLVHVNGQEKNSAKQEPQEPLPLVRLRNFGLSLFTMFQVAWT